MKSRLALASLAVLAVAGCSSGSSGGGGSNTADTPPPVTTTASQSATPSQTPSQTPKPTPSFSTTVQASHRCLTTQLSLSLGQGQGAAGSTIEPIVLTNKGSDACTLFGRPGVSFLDANGNQLGVSAVFGGSEPATVTLAPNGSANAQLQIPDPGNFPAADCGQATSARLQVYPPGDRAALTIANVTAVCTTKQGATIISPVTPGAGG